MSPTRRYLILFFATGAFIGKLPLAPGTWGSLLAVPIAFLLLQTHSDALFLTALVSCALSVPICDAAANILNQHDPSQVVLDEIAPMLLLLALIPPTIAFWSAAFILFRLLDSLKPPPIRKMEKLHGGAGIVADDLLAAAFVALPLLLIAHFIHQ